jgi:hypothetical protein
MKHLLTNNFFFIAIFFMGCAKPNEEFFSKEQILSICSNEKEKAISPETEVNLSKGNKGTSIALSLSFSSNFIKGISPDKIFDDCFSRLST